MLNKPPLNIDLSVKVSDGSFETKLSFPVDAAKEQRDWIVQSWLQAMDIAVKGGEVGNAG
jgi:hypothetical protein